MQYTEESSIGLIVKHRDGYNRYRILSYNAEGDGDAFNYTDNTISPKWFKIRDVNRWVKEGVWIPENSEVTFPIFN